MTRPILFDSCVFINYYRKSVIAKSWIDRVISRNISGRVTIINDFELFAGAKNNEDIKRYRRMLSFFQRATLHTTIARRAAEIAAPFYRAHNKSISIGDYLLASTAEYYGFDILTSNVNHFIELPLKGIRVIPFQS